MRYTVFCGAGPIGTVELRRPKRLPHRAASAQRMLRLPGDGPALGWMPGGRPVSGE